MTLARPGRSTWPMSTPSGGNSGSPVFMTPRSTLGGMVGSSNGVVPYGLLGVISGFENESENFSLQASTTTFQGSVQANSGISDRTGIPTKEPTGERTPAETERPSSGRAQREGKIQVAPPVTKFTSASKVSGGRACGLFCCQPAGRPPAGGEAVRPDALRRAVWRREAGSK